MKFYFFIAALIGMTLQAQVVNKTDSNRVKAEDSLVIDSGTRDSLKIFRPSIQDYRHFTQYSEAKIIDTVLSNEKTWQFTQWNNRDNFGRMQFANMGSGFNPLVYEVNPEQNFNLLPLNKSFGIYGIHDIKYYDVKTPTTTFIYHNAMRNGAALTSTYTQNIGKYFNFSVEYMGLRSQGLYSNSLAANNNTLFSGHYTAKNRKYEAFAHYIHQNVNNQENGGLANDELFITGDDAYENRLNAELNLEGSSSQFSVRRYYLSHQFSPFDPGKLPLKLRHTVFHQGNKYGYGQAALQPFFYDDPADIVANFPLSTGKYSKNLSNTVSALFDNEKFKMDVGVRYQMLKIGTQESITFEKTVVPEEVKESRIGAVGNLAINLWDRIALKSALEFSRGEKFGSFVRSENLFRFEPVEGYFVNAKVSFQSATPSFNYHLNSSPYRNFNYFISDFKNQTILEAGGNVNLKWFNSQIFANYFRIDNFTYFDAQARPQQSESSVDISQIGGEATMQYRKFHLNSRLLFQNTLSNRDLFPAPNFVGRANLYFQSKAFKNAAEIQAGIKTYFFSKFDSRDYFPVLNEFLLPNTGAFAIGGKPVVDVYFNLKVKRMFFFLEGQHLTTLIKHNTVYTAPHYPFYDFRLNIGIVWYIIS